MNETIKKKLSQLPNEPGVYFHKDKKGEIIYVGKAAILKNRVRQYFQASRNRDPKTEVLVGEIVDIEWITVETELDALFLEAELIKRYMPRFNIELRDDKSEVFVRIDMKDPHPTVQTTHRPLDDGAEYFGPYYSGFAVKKALKFLRKAFPYDTGKSSAKRVSLDYHIGLSPGLEEGKTTIEDYRKNLRKLMMYLKGERSALIRQLESEMKLAAKEKNFEQAARLRNQVYSLKELKKSVVFGKDEFMDISKDQALNGLVDLLELKGAPKRIEGYDISHMSGTDTVASMVVFTNGIPDKAEYRKFKMRIPGNDDFAHMNEVIKRRFSSKNIMAWGKPDLLLIDGGKGQLGAAQAALEEMGINIPSIGLAKRYETIIKREVVGKEVVFNEILLPKTSHIIKLLQRIRDESHRFAVSYHSVLKVKRQTKSLLDDIPTIGPATRKKLIKHFGGARAVVNASESELTQVIGPVKAKLLKEYTS